MRYTKIKSAFVKTAFAATVLLTASAGALAQQVVNLTASATSATLPDGRVVPMWGYSCGAAGTATCAAANPTVAAAQAAVTAGTATPAQTALAATWSPVVITVTTGQDLTINLTNNLPTPPGASAGIPTSLMIVGQIGGGLGTGGTSMASPDHSAIRAQTWPTPNGTKFAAPPQGKRVQSFGTEVASGATTALCWGPSCSTPTPPLLPGTYLIESGTHPSIQGPMGLYGVLVVTTAPASAGATGTAYPGVTYGAEVPLLLSEIDPVQNTAVSTAVNTTGFSETAVWSGVAGACGDPAVHTCYPPAVNYAPLYYLINGVAFDKTNAAKSVFQVTPGTTGTTTAGGNVLVRFVNAGLRMHVPTIVGAQTGTATPAAAGFTLIAEDGNPLPGQARVQSEVFLAAGKTTDVMMNAPAAGGPAIPVYDRQLSLSANATGRDGGMLAYIGINGNGGSAAGGTAGNGLPVSGALGAAIANVDTYNSVVAGKTLTVSDPSKGVVANDVNVYGVQVVGTVPAGLTLNPDGTFVYTGGVPTSFTYCGNGATSGPACAQVTLGAATLETASGITVVGDAFTSTLATSISIHPPGVLANDTDAAGYPLSVSGATATVPVTANLQAATGTNGSGTVTIDATGGFTATVSAPGTYTFTYAAQNSQGTTSTGTATVTLTFPAGSGLTVNVVDGADHKTPITDYRWIIEEDRTFLVDPACTTNPLPAGCPTISSAVNVPINYGTNFHTSSMPVVAAGCTGPLSCESGQSVQGTPAVCDIANGVCRTTAGQQQPMDPSQVVLDPSKRYYISVLPGDAATPFIAGYSGPPICTAAGAAAGQCGHGMGGAPIAAACGPQSPTNPTTGLKTACPAAGGTVAYPAVTVLTMPTPLPTATLSIFVFQDDYPLNGEHDAGGGLDVLATQEPGLGGFQITIYDQAGGTGDATGTPTYDMFNQPLANSLAGTIDPVTGLDACPISKVASLKSAANTAGAPGTPLSTATGMVVTCPKYEADGQTLSPMAGQAIVKNLYPGRYSIQAIPGADRIARGEEWVQTNTLDGQKAHDSFLRVGEPGYFQEFGPAGFHVSIGFANPKIINDRRTNSVGTGMCDQGASGGKLSCGYEVKGKVTGSRLSRTPDQRLYSSGSRDALAFTQCYVSLGDPDGADFAFTKCDADGNFDFPNIPAGNWKVTTFDQWNDQIIDGITQPVSLGCANNVGGLCTIASGATNAPSNTTCAGPTSSATTCDMGEIGVHQWQADLYTRTFIDTTRTGLSDDVATGSNKPGLALVPTNVRFRDGSYSNFNSTDLQGYAGFNEVFPLFNWYVVETDNTRYKTTGVHVIYDAGGPADGSASCGTNSPCGGSNIAAGLANTYEKYPLPADLSVPGAVYCSTADCYGQSISGGPKPSSVSTFSTGRIDPPFWFGSYGWQGFIGQGNFLEFGKVPYAANETGPIHGHVVYASTRPYDDPQLLLQNSWEPMVAHVRVNLYKEGLAADGVTPTLTLIDHTDTSSWDDWAQGFRSDGKPNMNCPGQQAGTDPFYYALQNQPHYLDWYNAQHGGPAMHTLPYSGQYKCFDGMHTWNQLQPAPYDGMYSFPSVTSLDPTTGKPAGTNCTACVTNPDSNDTYRFGTPMLPAGKYVVEVVVPPGYELVKEEDKNILIGDNYIAPAAVQFPGLGGSVYILPDQAALSAAYNPLNPQNATNGLGRNPALPSHEGDTGSVESYWPCVGQVRQVPDYISLFPQSHQVAPFAGAMRPLCDRKEVTLDYQSSVLTKFYIFSSTHKAAHFTGIILDDFAAEFDPYSPQFGEKFAPSYLPVGVKDWSGNAVHRVYADQFGLYNGLNYSTWEVNPPNPTGYAPTMMVMCMNDSGMGPTPDPLYQPGYSQFCYELPFMPGQTGYFDTPVVPVQAFASGSYNRPDCAYPDATPAVASVTGDVAGPWVSAPGKSITINALGNQSVDWYGYTGPSIPTPPYNQQKITRHYGFGATKGTVSIGGVTVPAAQVTWGDAQITLTVPAGIPACALQQQPQYQTKNGVSKLATGASPTAACGELVITTAAGRQSIDTVTVTVGGSTPTVLPAGTTIQSAIDAADPGDMIIVPPGVYNEMLVMWKPVRLQGVGAASSVIDAAAHPSGLLLNPWRQRMVGLFGLTVDGRPDTSNGGTCVPDGTTPLNVGGVITSWCNFPAMIVDRLPFEATLGWDASLNGNLAEQLIEPSLLGAYEGAAITVLGKGVKFPAGTAVLDAYGATTGTPGAAFPDNTTLLSKADCLVSGNNPYPSNFFCNPSSIDALGIRNSSQGGGGIFAHAYTHYLQIANNRVSNNTGTMSGGMTIGAGEHPDVAVSGQTIVSYPTSCESSKVANVSLPFCFNMVVNIHHNAVVANSSLGDELFSSTPAGAGGVSLNTGADYYSFTNNWVCGNLSSGDGGGVSHIGFSKYGDIEHNTIIFNQSTNPSISTNGGGLLVMGAPDVDPTTCGVANDQDCVAPAATILPSDGTGPGLFVNANLILGNAADSGSGGGMRIQHVNGTDVLNLPDGARWCTADLGAGTPTQIIGDGGGGGNLTTCTRVLRPGHSPGDSCLRGGGGGGITGPLCYWNSIAVENNIIVNNVAGWDGAGLSLLDSLAVNMMNNTIASNDSTASSGTLFQSLFAPLASAPAPTTNVICGSNNGQSCPQVAGLVSVSNSPVLQANIGLLPTFGSQTVTVAAALRNGSATFNLNNPPALLEVGSTLAGTGIPAGTVVSAIAPRGNNGGVTVTMSNVATANANSAQITIGYPAILAAAKMTCPGGHGVPIAGGEPSCFYNSIPLLFNEVIWGNRSFYIGVSPPGGGNQSQQNIVTLYNANGSAVANQPKAGAISANGNGFTVTGGTGACVAGVSYWDLGFRGDTAPTNHAAAGLLPYHSVISAATAATYGGSATSTAQNYISVADPTFENFYCNGSRTPPELGTGGYAVPPGVNEFNGFPNPVFTLNPSGVVDEGNNWINVRWGPLALTNPLTPSVPLGNYIPATGSPAIDSGLASITFGTGAAAIPVLAPPTDFYGTPRPLGGGFDIGAVEAVGGGTASLRVAPTSLTLTTVFPAVSAAGTLTVTNAGAGAANLAGALSFSSTVFTRSGGSCGATLNGNSSCTITVVYTPAAVGTVTGTLTIAATDAFGNGLLVVGSPVALTGTSAIAPTLTSIAPISGSRGTTVPVTLTGNNLTGATAVNVSGGNVACTGIVSTATTVTANCAITATATLSARNVTVTTPSGTSNAVVFTVTGPTLTSITPTTGVRGTTVPVTLTGTDLSGATAVNVSGGNVACTGIVSTATQVTANCAIAAGASLTARNVTVTTPNGTTNAQTFTVTGATVSFSTPSPTLAPAPAATAAHTGTITVTNTGTGALTLTAAPTVAKVGSAGGTFTIVTGANGGTCVAGAVVAPTNGTCTIVVQYAPANASTTQPTASARVTVTGTGLAAPGTATSTTFTAN